MPLLVDCPIQEKAWHDGERNGVPIADRSVRKPIAQAGPWEPSIQKILTLQHLRDNWDGFGATAPSAELVESAVSLAYLLHKNGVSPPSRVVPGLEGAVLFEWQDSDGTYTDIEIVRPFFAEVMLVEPGKPAKHCTLPTE